MKPRTTFLTGLLKNPPAIFPENDYFAAAETPIIIKTIGKINLPAIQGISS